MDKILWGIFKEHCGHNVEIVEYGNGQDYCLECTDCNEVLLDAEIYTICAREDDDSDNTERDSRRDEALKVAKELWEELSEVIVDENDCLESDWNIFPKGTSKIDIWHWFEAYFGVSIIEDLME